MTIQPMLNESSPVAVAELSRQLFQRVAELAKTDFLVVITGETGVGKKTVARVLHAQSVRATKPFVILHGVDASVSTLIDAVMRAEGGTLVLDGLADFPADVQSRIVAILRAGRGLGTPRIVATGGPDLMGDVRRGALREDLYFLISELTINVVPLRDRIEDILPLAARFLATVDRSVGPAVLGTEAIELLRQHRWPGNVRELFNVLRRAAFESSDELIGAASIVLDSGVTPTIESSSAVKESITIDGRGVFARQRDQAERAILLAALRDGRGTRTDVAQRLGISPRTLRYKLARLRAAGMELPA